MESKFKINNIRLLNTWCYDLNNTDCTICRTNLNTNSIYSQEKNKDSVVVSGMCGHSFHYECISPWIKINNSCPICSANWIYQLENLKCSK
jgi:hypothetical protein